VQQVGIESLRTLCLILLLPSAPQLLQDVLADAGFLCGEVAMLKG